MHTDESSSYWYNRDTVTPHQSGERLVTSPTDCAVLQMRRERSVSLDRQSVLS